MYVCSYVFFYERERERLVKFKEIVYGLFEGEGAGGIQGMKRVKGYR